MKKMLSESLRGEGKLVIMFAKGHLGNHVGKDI